MRRAKLSLKTKRTFPGKILDAIRDDKMLRIRAGTGPHRFIGIWAVVVEERVFVRSWSLKPRSWYRTFLEEPRGAVLVDGREFAVRAVLTRSDRLNDAIDRAYLEKYNTRGSLKYARGPGTGKIESYDHGAGSVLKNGRDPWVTLWCVHDPDRRPVGAV